MTKPKTSWTGISKNKTQFAINPSLEATIINYDDASTLYDDNVYYDGYNPSSGSLNTTKKDASWNET